MSIKTQLRDFLIGLRQSKQDAALARKKKLAADAKAVQEAQRKIDQDAYWVDEGHRLNFYQVDDFLAGRNLDRATPPPSPDEWKVLRASWTPDQYALTAPSLQGSVPANRLGSMVGNTASEIEAEKWRLMAAAKGSVRF